MTSHETSLDADLLERIEREHDLLALLSNHQIDVLALKHGTTNMAVVARLRELRRRNPPLDSIIYDYGEGT